MFGLGAGELLVIFILALIFIGPKKLPELAKGLGKGIREFQKAKDDIMDDINKPDSPDETNLNIADTEKNEAILKSDNDLENNTEIIDTELKKSDNLVSSGEDKAKMDS